MKRSLPRLFAALAVLASLPLIGALPADTPFYKYTQTLVASADCGERNYLMVPVCLRVDEHDLLVGYKRGAAHFREQEAGFEILRLDPVTQRVDPTKIALSHPGVVFQDGEFVRFANGDIACYIDVQAGSSDALRLGLVEYRSRDGGRTFQDRGKVGLIDGVEYGYAFEGIGRGADLWMLAMRFTNLPGGGPAAWPHHQAGSVDVIHSSDNGRTWHFVRNLTEEFHGFPINESSFAFAGDGFVVNTRGYDNRQRLQLTDANFRLRRQVDLNATYPFINSYIGRPRIFVRDGHYYFMGRNWTKPGAMSSPLGHGQPAVREAGHQPMDLSLFRFDPESLALTRHVILDNAEAENVVDGYYAVPYWQERAGRMYLNTVIYKRPFGRTPDIVRLEFAWDEVR